MALRQAFVRYFGPGLLGGITFGDWLRLLRENRWAVSPKFFPRAFAITAHSLQNSLHRWREARRYGEQWRAVEVPPPLFVLGHWRTGTTHLHNLLTVDRRFAFPNNYQTLFPHTFFVTERLASPLIGWLLPKRRPMDNVEWTMQSPQEDEFSLLLTCGQSPYLSFAFPRRRDAYDRFLTFGRATAAEVGAWKETFIEMLKKLTLKHGRPLVLKSPPHTARIKLLLEMFPEARFVHIYRNPYAVFPSTVRTFRVNLQWHRLHEPPQDDLEEYILRHSRELYDAYFQERSSIPQGRLHEVCFEQLESDPLGEVRKIYQALALPDFSAVEGDLRAYVASIAGYEKNRFAELSPELKRRIRETWAPCFEAWGYPT